MMRLRLASLLAAPLLAAAAVEFNRDIQPILSDRCFACHGPDAKNRGIKLRLDSDAGMFADLGGRAAVVPGDPEKSELMRRIRSTNPAVRMPPAYTGTKLSEGEIELLRQWIAEGARWQKHWSLIAPQRPPLPAVRNRSWPRNAIDYFVLARLEKEGIEPSPEASKETLIRRVSLDLTGLPPSPEEVDAFLNDHSADAYERVVDRLLASPRYGERMAIRWLEAARYADTNGYQTDAERFMWRWRDWVIDAFNRDMPFDQFTIEQLAGDLLPAPRREQIIATGFNRNHRGNGEGGIIPEEYLVEYAADRVETMSTVWMGITMGCARCHEHKYDPFTQKDYYQLFAYFNNIPEKGRYFKYGNTPPLIAAPTPEQERRLSEMGRQIEQAAKRWQALAPDVESAFKKWQRSLRGAAALDWQPNRFLVAHFPLEPESGKSAVAWDEGVLGKAASFDGRRFYEAGKFAEFNFYDSFTLAAWIRPAAGTGAIVTRAKDALEESGIAMMLKDGKLQLNLVQRWLDDAIRVESEQSVPLNEWHHVMASYDGSRVAGGIRLYIDGRPVKVKVLLDELNQDFKAPDPWRIGGGGGEEIRFQGLIDEVRVYNRALGEQEAAMLAVRENLNAIGALASERRSQAQQLKLRQAFIEQYAAESLRQAWRQWADLVDARAQFEKTIPAVMVMQENPRRNPAHILIRGAYDRKGEPVRRGVPAALPPLPADAPDNRLGLARWLVDPKHPLTARVTVNRFWQMYFGSGLVKTAEDFGSQGERPSHPELLDWLAVEFIESGWKVKALQKLIVMSATYRQQSRLRPELQQRDPENRLLARGPRLRLSAEMVRDQALAISGLLVEKIGGPSVKPYQPAGLWKELTGGADYQRDSGENLYRRSLYTFWKRSAPPPAMMNFDASSRETCVVRENRTNTPLQALNLMNDVTYLEAARKMAERMIRQGGAAVADRLAYGFRLATARRPRPEELDVLMGHYRYQLDYYQTRRDDALKLLAQGESARDPAIDASELAAYSMVASLILNLDEVISKQ